MTPTVRTYCEEHPDTEPIYVDFGDGESGPQEPVLVCPDCMEQAKPKCPKCGAVLIERVRPTLNYGGGWDTYVKCPGCDYAEVYV